MVKIPIRGQRVRHRDTFAGFNSLIRKAQPPGEEVAHIQQRLIDEIATLYEGKLRQAFIEAVNRMTDADALTALQSAIAAGDWTSVQQLTGVASYQLALGELNNALLDAFTVSGTRMAYMVATGKADAGPLKINFAFDRTNPAAVQAMRQISDNLSSTLGQDTTGAVQRILQQQVERGLNPATSAAKIKQIVGLNAQQVQALQNFEMALQSGQLGAAKGYSLTQSDQGIIDAAMKGKPLPQSKIAQLVENYRKRLLAQRATMIARTESMSAVAAGADHAWGQAVTASGLPPENFKRFWVATNDSRTRPDHVAIPHLNAQGVGMTEPFKYPGGTIMRPHDPNAPAKEVINCLLPGTRVYADGILATTRRPFEGNVVTIHSASGRNVTVTVNHPILTVKGWVRAKDIQCGDQIINDGWDNWTAERTDNDHIPSRIEDVESALGAIGSVRIGKITAGVDFHGDAANGEVRIVTRDRSLVIDGHPSIPQPICKQSFTGRNFMTDALAGQRLLPSEIFAFLSTSDARMSRLNSPTALLLRHLAPLGEFGFGLASQDDTGRPQSERNGRPTDPVLLGELINRNPLGIITDKVINVSVKFWSGHVYNLQTESGIYSANGIINHNCRCCQIVRYVPPTMIAPLPVFAGRSILPE